MTRASREWTIPPFVLKAEADRIIALGRARGWKAVVLPLEATYYRRGAPIYQAFALRGDSLVRLTGVVNLRQGISSVRAEAGR